jgi:hypothetical protein
MVREKGATFVTVNFTSTHLTSSGRFESCIVVPHKVNGSKWTLAHLLASVRLMNIAFADQRPEMTPHRGSLDRLFLTYKTR